MTTILSVICKGIEYRCEETKKYETDMRGDRFASGTTRSRWLSAEGNSIGDHEAMALLNERMKVDADKELLSRLFPGTNARPSWDR